MHLSCFDLRFGQGVENMLQNVPSLLDWAQALHSHLELGKVKAMMVGCDVVSADFVCPLLCVCVLGRLTLSDAPKNG